MWFASSINTWLISALHVEEKGAQFLNATSVSLSAVTALSPVTKINASEWSLDLMLSVSSVTELFWLYLSFSVWLPITYHFLQQT